MNYDHLLTQAEQFVRSYFSEHDNANLSYHNLHHTEKVVSAAEEISKHYKLDEKSIFIVLTAAWFHDIGYYVSFENHEQHSNELAKDFLKSINDQDIVDAISGCIMATRMPQNPKNILEEIICDADLYQLGKGSFDENNKSLRQEFKVITGKKISKEEWNKKTLQFLEQHHYHTEYCRNILDEHKRKQIILLKEKIAKANQDNDSKHSNEMSSETDKKEKKDKENRPDRAVETMFRITSGNNQRLSDMADKKADILITVNAIILSAVLTILVRKLEDSQHLIIPTIIILSISVITMIFAILSTRPSIPHGTFTQEDLSKRKVNLIFFGNYYNMSYDRYLEGMKEVMNDKAFLYETMVKDIYSQGVVLGKKYHLLRVAYNVFMFGLIASVLAFIIAVSLYS